jgi:hypothetical protein
VAILLKSMAVMSLLEQTKSGGKKNEKGKD